jgi:uncharacterized iron-regulated membrane protein
MKRFRKIIFWCHLTAGVLAGLIILLMSVTGVLLAFEPQIVRFAERDMRRVQPPEENAVRLGPQVLLAKALEAKPNAKPTGLTLQADKTASASLALGREGVLYLNPYTGEVLGEGAKATRGFFRVVTDWHRWLGMQDESRAIGRAITGACNAAFLLLALTGIYIWWPKQLSWRFLKPIIFFKRRHNTPRARDFNWHNTIGFWSSSILILLTITGLVISYQWANNLLYRLTGNQPPAQQQVPPAAAPNTQVRTEQEPRIEFPTVNLDQLWLRAEQQVAGWKSITLRLPVRSGAPVAFSIDEGASWNPIARSQLTLDPKTDAVKWEPYAGLNAGRKLRSWVRATHTGEAGGIVGQILACLASLGGAVLVWTGLALAWRRFRAWLVRRKLKGANANMSDEIDYRDEVLSS